MTNGNTYTDDGSYPPYLWRCQFEATIGDTDHDVLHLPGIGGDEAGWWESNGENITIVTWNDQMEGGVLK